MSTNNKRVEGNIYVMKDTIGKIIAITILCVACSLTACNNKGEQPGEVATTAPTTDLEATKTTETPKEATDSAIGINKHKGQRKSKLTGLWIDKKLVNQRPFAIMINNIKNAASRHSGISQASVLYEAIAEGEITRLMGIFENFNSNRIGSVRSARHYFVSIADEYDAIYVHYGQTSYALNKISELGVDNLSGLSSEGTTVFYRDRAIRAPHNAFTSYDGIMAGMKKKGYRTNYRENEKHYQFYSKNTILKKGKKAEKLTLGYSNKPYFEYDNQRKTYQRFQFGTPHIDVSNKKQLSFKNIIVQFVREWNIDKNGYQTIDFANSSGKGYYATNGRVVEITWKKNESTKEMHYYSANGKELKINPGKTYIAIYPDNRTEEVQFSANNK